MKKQAVRNVVLATIVLVLYLAFFFVYNYYYINDLNQYFKILTSNTDMITAVNASRYATNQKFVKYELYLGLAGIVVVGLEIAAIRKMISLYKDLAFRDVLTKAYSRVKLEDVFDKIEAKKNVKTCTYFLFDMNYLKQINDGYGHKVGDDFIIAMGRILRQVFAGKGQVYRLGGDEFVAFCTGNDDPEKFIEKIDEAVDVWNSRSNRINTNLSFAKGYFHGEWDYDDILFRDTLYTEADNAMYEEKEAFHRIHPKSERIDRETKQVVVRRL